MTLHTKGRGPGNAIGVRAIVPVFLLLAAVLVVLFAEKAVNGRRKPAGNANEATADIVRRARDTVDRVDRRLTEQTAVAPAEIAALSVQPATPKPVPRVAAVQPFAAAPDPIDSAALTVTAIFWNPRSPLATVNGRLVGVGGAVEDFRVVVIEKESVILEGPTKKRRTFRLYAEADLP